MKRGISPEREAQSSNPHKKAKHSNEALLLELKDALNHAEFVHFDAEEKADLLDKLNKIVNKLEFEDLDFLYNEENNYTFFNRIIQLSYDTNNDSILMSILNRFRDHFTKEYFTKREMEQFNSSCSFSLLASFIKLSKNSINAPLQFVFDRFGLQFTDLDDESLKKIDRDDQKSGGIFNAIRTAIVQTATLENFIALINDNLKCPNLFNALFERFKDQITMADLLKLSDKHAMFPLLRLGKEKDKKEAIDYFLKNTPGVIPGVAFNFPAIETFLSMDACVALSEKHGFKDELDLCLNGEFEPIIYKLSALQTIRGIKKDTSVNFSNIFTDICFSLGRHFYLNNEHQKASKAFNAIQTGRSYKPGAIAPTSQFSLAVPVQAYKAPEAPEAPLSSSEPPPYPLFSLPRLLLQARNAFFSLFDKVKNTEPVTDALLNGLLTKAHLLQKEGYLNVFYELGRYFETRQDNKSACMAFLRVPKEHDKYQQVCIQAGEMEFALAVSAGIYQETKTQHLRNSLAFAFKINDKQIREELIQNIAELYIYGDRTLGAARKPIPEDWLKVISQVSRTYWTLDRFNEIKQSLKLEKKRAKLQLPPRIENSEDSSVWLENLEKALKQPTDSERYQDIQNLASQFVGEKRSDLIPATWFTFVNAETDTKWFYRRLQDIKRCEETKREIKNLTTNRV